MSFNENITLNKYAEEANLHFDKMQDNLSEIDGKFHTRMNGKTTGRLILSFIGTVCWLIILLVGVGFTYYYVHFLMPAISAVAILGLVTFMTIDNLMSFSYYSKLDNYKGSVVQLQNRVKMGKDSINSNHSIFMSTKSKGWQFELKAGPSIPEEALSIENIVSSMESLKNGFVNSAKNVFFFVTVIAVTVTSCVALFPVGSEIICGISGESFEQNVLNIFNIVALVIVGIIEILFSKWAWGKSDCTVTNITIFVILFAPVAFLALIALATLIVMLVIGILSIVLALGALAIGISCLSGG